MLGICFSSCVIDVYEEMGEGFHCTQNSGCIWKLENLSLDLSQREVAWFVRRDFTFRVFSLGCNTEN